MIEKVTDFVSANSGVWFETPRKGFFGGRSLRAQKFRCFLKSSNDQIVFNFESGTVLPIEIWRVAESIKFLKKKDVVEIGARISEEYSKESLEGHLKSLAKEKYQRQADTKTAPHIVDLLVLSGIAELDYTISSSGRQVQGVRLKETI